MKYTENYKLKKPDGNEYVSIEQINENMETIDTELAKQKNDLNAHNLDPKAHPSIQIELDDMDGRLAALELKYGSNVTGNSFNVTFADLDGLIVTGVWNETYALLEF